MVSIILTRVMKCLSFISWVGIGTWPRSECEPKVAEDGSCAELSIVMKLPFETAEDSGSYIW